MFSKASLTALALVGLCLSPIAYAAFGLTTSGSNFIVDTNAGLVFTVKSTSGDITSMLFNDIQTQTQNGKFSQIVNICIVCNVAWLF